MAAATQAGTASAVAATGSAARAAAGSLSALAQPDGLLLVLVELQGSADATGSASELKSFQRVATV